MRKWPHNSNSTWKLSHTLPDGFTSYVEAIAGIGILRYALSFVQTNRAL